LEFIIKTSKTLPLFIEVPVPEQVKSVVMCVLGVSVLSLSVIYLLDFETVPTVWYFLFFILFQQFSALL